MHLPILVSSILIATLVPAFAITDAEITPAALAGKTLTFTIETAGGAFADTGTWAGTFGNPAFTVAKLTGSTVDIATTHSTVLNGFTTVTLPKYVEGSGVTTITLFTSAGIGRYEMNFSPVDSAYQIGTFTLGAPVVDSAEIDVRQGGASLVDGSGKIFFPSQKVGQASATKKFVIKNTGTAKLTGLRIAKTGAHKANFTVSPLTKTGLAAGDSMAFKVTFKPSRNRAVGARIHISSNDSNENPFDIKLEGAVVRLIDPLP